MKRKVRLRDLDQFKNSEFHSLLAETMHIASEDPCSDVRRTLKFFIGRNRGTAINCTRLSDVVNKSNNSLLIQGVEEVRSIFWTNMNLIDCARANSFESALNKLKSIDEDIPLSTHILTTIAERSMAMRSLPSPVQLMDLLRKS